MKNNVLYFLIAMIIGITCNQAIATPITDNSLIHIEQFVNAFGATTTPFSSNSTNNSFSNRLAVTGDTQAFGNFSTGQVGTRVVDPTENIQSTVIMYDTLTFNTSAPVEVSFDLRYEGTLASRDRFSLPLSQSTVRVFDITGLSSWLETKDFIGLFDTVGVTANAAFILREELIFELDAPTGGTEVEFDSTLSGSFIADPSKIYGIEIMSNTGAGNKSSADFLGTGTFQFTNLNGATFNSGSGAFLTTVPVPSAVWLLGSGLIGLFGLKRKSSTLPA